MDSSVLTSWYNVQYLEGEIAAIKYLKDKPSCNHDHIHH
jgi:hypothetical protein